MTRIILAVLAGTFAFFLGGFLIHGVLLFPDWHALNQSLGLKLSGEMSPAGLAVFLLVDIGRALGAVGLVAAIRGRCGCPFATALLAGGALWALTSGLPRLVEAPIGVYPVAFLAKAGALELIPPLVSAAAAVAILRRPVEVDAPAQVEPALAGAP